jgi:hypothetical protein
MHNNQKLTSLYTVITLIPEEIYHKELHGYKISALSVGIEKIKLICRGFLA